MNTVEIKTPRSTHQVLEEKLTSLGLYVTALEAYEMWKADPERTKVLDVRTFEEYVLIGHAEMAANVPLAFPTYNWDAGKGNYSVVGNKDFMFSHGYIKHDFDVDAWAAPEFLEQAAIEVLREEWQRRSWSKLPQGGGLEVEGTRLG